MRLTAIFSTIGTLTGIAGIFAALLPPGPGTAAGIGLGLIDTFTGLGKITVPSFTIVLISASRPRARERRKIRQVRGSFQYLWKQRRQDSFRY